MSTVTTAATFVDGLDAGIASIEGESEAVLALRLEGSRAFAAAGVPTPKQEAWRFTNLKDLAATPHDFGGPANVDITPWQITDSHRLVFVNGRFADELSHVGDLPDGVTISPLATALATENERAAFALGKGVDLESHPFAALNTANFVDGAFINLSRGAIVDKPIHLLFVAVGGGRPTWSAPRNVISADPTSEATIVEHYVGTGGETLTVPVTEFHLAPGAVVKHIRLQEESRHARHIALQTSRQGRDSRLESVALNVGAALSRTNIDAELNAPGAHASLDGLYLVENSQHTDSQLKVRHSAPHCTSHELYKGVLDGKSKAVFNGRIVVDPGAQKTDAIQSNRNLLLSAGALVNSNPQLEILADDVRCTHGSTVGRLDEEAIFYLRSRGIGRATAESLLTYAFAAEVVQQIPVAEIRERMERHLVERLPQGELAREAF
jgi:Fe-S cluster assembly protein SufD